MLICGIDEAGRGCLAGSLFVAGVACKEAVLKNGLNEHLIKMGIKDSKKLSKKKRYALESRLDAMSHLCHFVVEKTASEIDTKGLSACLKEALEEIIQCVIKLVCDNDLCATKAQDMQNLHNQQILPKAHNLQNQPAQNPKNPHSIQPPQHIRFYFDGNSAFGASVENALKRTNIDFSNINATLECVIKGDEKIPLISCASIYAKCAKDTQSANLANIYPQYDLATNAGYGTKAHINAILKYGISPIHRASFCAKFMDFGESNACSDSRQFSYFAEYSAQKHCKAKPKI